MTLPESLAPLLKPEAYPHRCDDVELVETHISWVLLTGTFAYKLKKPVDFGFVDFSSLERRAHFCREELRCNRAFAPDLYVDVIPVVRTEDGRIRMSGSGEVIEWAVKMHQFPPERQLDRVLDEGTVADADLRRLLSAFGERLAQQHAARPALETEGKDDLDDALERRIVAPMEANFTTLLGCRLSAQQRDTLDRCRSATRWFVDRLRPRLRDRLRDGFVRECHGDLHLANLVHLDAGITAFDCLEFNPDLRWIDIMSDAAFLFMDCVVRGRGDLGYAFADGYADAGGDYDGLVLLPLYSAYRSMVRAKVAALQLAQNPGDAAAAERLDTYLNWTDRRFARAAFGSPAPAPAQKGGRTGGQSRQPPRLIVMCGLSGSGKSHVAARLVPQLGALRLRSDVLRRQLVRVDRGARSGPGTAPGGDPLGGDPLGGDPPGGDPPRGDTTVGRGRYSAENVGEVYAGLNRLAVDLLRWGETLILDATFLDGARRRAALRLAEQGGVSAVVLYCHAPHSVLRERVAAREAEGRDPSEAGVAVLEAQREHFQAPGADEHVVHVDTSAQVDVEALHARLLAM